MPIAEFARRFLDLSTAHVGPETRDQLNDGLAGAFNTVYGWFVYVPSTSGHEVGIPNDLSHVFAKAREFKCDYVLFDRDACKLDDLPIWDW